MKNRLINLFPMGVLLLSSGCSAFQTGPDHHVGFTETGLASYYADKHVNGLTANGERYRHDRATAAHKTLAFGSLVRVTNLKNGKNVVVKINDRGPFVRGRIIDLSRSAFSQIGHPSQGLLSVKIEVIK